LTIGQTLSSRGKTLPWNSTIWTPKPKSSMHQISIQFPFFTIADGWIPYVTVKCPRSFSLPNIPDETHVTCVDMEDEPQAPGTCMWEIDLTVGNLKILWNSNSIRLWCKYTQYNLSISYRLWCKYGLWMSMTYFSTSG
jgi:hypothetical protein